MIGGVVVEVTFPVTVANTVWIRVRDKIHFRTTCGVLVERNENSEAIEFGDEIWWHGDWVMWTPAQHYGCNHPGAGDIKIPKIGYSMTKRPT